MTLNPAIKLKYTYFTICIKLLNYLHKITLCGLILVKTIQKKQLYSH